MNKEQLSYIERKAQEPIKSLSLTANAILFIPFFLLGLYYLFIDDVLFNYNDISPIGGLFIFIILGIILIIIGNQVFNYKWKKYNAKIEDAINTIEDLIKNASLPPEDLFRLKKDNIERKLDRCEDISQDEYLWHSNIVCWGCGKFHGDKKTIYTYTKERTVSWKEGVIRYRKTYTQKAHISLCPQCYNAVINSDRIFQSNQKTIIKIDVILCIIATIMTLLICEETFGNSIAIVLMCIGVCVSIGQLIIFPLSYLIAKPFTDNTKGFTPKWYFDNIPIIKDFMNRDLRH